jgi:hypothetical protein
MFKIWILAGNLNFRFRLPHFRLCMRTRSLPVTLRSPSIPLKYWPAMSSGSFWHNSCLKSFNIGPRFVILDGVMSSILCVWLIVVYYFKHFIVKLNLFVNENSTDIIYCTKGDIRYLKKIQIIYVTLLECAMYIFECANVSFPFVVNKHLCKEKQISVYCSLIIHFCY